MNTSNGALQHHARRALLGGALALLAACSSTTGPGGSASGNGGISLGSGSSQNDPVSPDFPIAYVKRALPSAANAAMMPLNDDLRVQRVWNGPADVWLRERASTTAADTNITTSVTGGAWDVRDLDVSFDGTKLIF
jgi:hypothetical protein